MLNKALQKEIESGVSSPLYFLWSDESCFLDEALAGIVKTVMASGPADFNYDVFDSSSRPQEIVDAALTLPVMAMRRLVVLKDFHELNASAVQVLTPYLDGPSATTCMVVLSKNAPRAALKFNWKVYSLNIKEWDIPAWLRNYAAGKGVKMSADAVEMLIEFVGHDVGLLISEVEKLALSGSGTVTGKDIISSTSTMRKYTSFDLLDTLIAGQNTRAFRILNTMLSGNAFDAPVILGTLNWHFKQFYTLWRNNGQRPAKMREKTYRTLVKYLPSYKEDDFYRIFRSLHEADLGIKTTGRPGLVLEVLLIRLLQKGVWN
ncbi:MAG: DNA polymerase III subunit delta [Nitrospiraceae bacterium]|nr:MAG: DNA polymerase III subunit delta [Nitrospiraceae bacterium]